MSYIRVAWGKLTAGGWEQFERHYKEKIAPTINTTKGLQYRALLPSTDIPDEGVSITLWETLEDMQNYERSEQHRTLASGMEHLFTGEYWVKHFELVSIARPE